MFLVFLAGLFLIVGLSTVDWEAVLTDLASVRRQKRRVSSSH
jgi:hypothetical protein